MSEVLWIWRRRRSQDHGYWENCRSGTKVGPVPLRASGHARWKPEEKLRELAWAHVALYTGDHTSPDSFEFQHVEAIVDRIAKWMAGIEDRPWLHSHAYSEFGTCTECDAAAVLRRFEGGDEH